ncbi:MAG: 2-oxo acid dehydrogenase subunit E2 [Caulobacterales bacterium]|nr:2-oxo acid dehydrogenase subunit E2 [Caulobacterales bacterium]
MSHLVDLAMPKLGLTMTEGVVVAWACAEGGPFREGDVLAVVETDKIANDVAAPADGVLRQILVASGEPVPVGTAIAQLELQGADMSEGISRPDRDAVAPGPERPAVVQPGAESRATRGSARVVATPLARRLARAAGCDIGGIDGSGPRGRIVAADVLAATARAVVRPDPPRKGSFREDSGERAEPGRWVEASTLDAPMACRPPGAEPKAPHLRLATEVDLSALLEVKALAAGRRPDLRLTLTPFFLLAVGRALQANPAANQVWRDERVWAFERIDCGVAIATAAGIFTPVLRDIVAGGLGHLAEALTGLIARTKAGALATDDQGSCACTVANCGMYGVSYVSPVIDPGQSSILGLGPLRPVFRPDEESQPQLIREVGAVLSCDHRVFDAASALSFLNAIKRNLENPLLML